MTASHKPYTPITSQPEEYVTMSAFKVQNRPSYIVTGRGHRGFWGAEMLPSCVVCSH